MLSLSSPLVWFALANLRTEFASNKKNGVGKTANPRFIEINQ